MRVIPPITIVDSMLVSSLVETPPAAYAGGTTYTLADTCSTGTVGGVITVWKSLQGANTGHTPAEGSAWWQNIGTTYSVYNAGATYGLAARVIDPTAHQVYESQMAGNTGQPLTVGTAWAVIGPTNKMAAFDQLRDSQAEAPVDIVQTIQLADRASSLAVIGLDARFVTITQTVSGVQRYSKTFDLKTRKSRSWKEYFFGKFSYRTSIQVFDLPLYRNAQLTVTVSKPGSGRRAVGGILIGNAVYIGEAQYEAISDHLNFSGVDRTTFGGITLIPRRSVPKVDLNVWFDKSLTGQILALRDQLNAKPAIWSGIDDFTLDYFDPLFIYGIHKEFSLNLKEFEFGIITLQVEEM